MSSMRNAIQRRSHRERAQPLDRQRLGLLEKDKDRKLRQKDYKKKQETLKALREKAANRNEDEFHFGMVSRQGPGSRLSQGKRWSGTVAGDRGNKALPVDVVRLLKTQDVGYVRTMRSVVIKEVRRLREQLVIASNGLPESGDDEEDKDDEGEFDFAAPISSVARPKKIVFVDGEARKSGEDVDSTREREKGDEEAEDGFDDGDTEDGGEGEDGEDEELARKTKNLKRIRRELELAEKKLKVLTEAERELEVQKAKMAKTATSGGFTRRGKKIMVRARKK